MGKLLAIFRRLGTSTPSPSQPTPSIPLTPPTPDPPPDTPYNHRPDPTSAPDVYLFPPNGLFDSRPSPTLLFINTDANTEFEVANINPHGLPFSPPELAEIARQLQAGEVGYYPEVYDHGNRYEDGGDGMFYPIEEEEEVEGDDEGLRYSNPWRASYFFYIDGVRFDIENPSASEPVPQARLLEVMNRVRRCADAGDLVGRNIQVTVGGQTYLVS